MPKSLLMTPARRITLALGMPAALIMIGWTGLAAVSWAGRGSYPVHFSVPARGGQVSVSVGSGTVSVRPGTGSRVAVSGTVHYSLVRPKVSLRSTGSGVAVDSSCQVPAVPCSFDYAVAVPAGLGANFSVGSGDLSASGLSGPVTLSAESGDVHVSGVAGNVQVKSQSGDITAAALAGPDTRIEDQSGDVKITSLSGQDVTVSDESGNITLDFTAVPRRVVIIGQSGNITVVLPPGGTTYRVTARTSAGSTTTAVPTDPGSSHVITATTESGDITIVR